MGTNPTKKILYVILTSLNTVCIIAILCLTAAFGFVSERLPSQNAVKEWQSENGVKYEQLSLFIEKGSGINLDEIRKMRVDIDKKLAENSFAAEKEGSRLYFDGFSCSPQSMTVTAVSDSYAPRVEAETIVTGGDFFKFHQLELLSGCYYSDDDLMQDRVIIDETLAWQLFGSNNVSGMAVTIGEKVFTVAGVVRMEQDKASQYVINSKPHMFISLDGAKLIDNSPEITCVEIVLPNPVKGLAESIFSEVISVSEENYILVDNSQRFSLINILKSAFDGGKGAVVEKAVVYPYWENAARITIENAENIVTAIAVLICVPILTLLYFVFLLFIKRKIILHKTKEKLVNAAGLLIKKMKGGKK